MLIDFLFDPDDTMQLVLIHNGNDWYLDYTVQQASYSNPNTPLLIIGDSKTESWAKRYPKIRFYHQDQLKDERYKQFVACYKPFTYNSENYNRYCTERWFFLRNLIDQQPDDIYFYIDSDVLLFQDIAALYQKLELSSYTCGFHIPKTKNELVINDASAHFSFWTQRSIHQFTDFIIDSYQNEAELDLYDQHFKNSGDVSDMTQLFQYFKSASGSIYNFCTTTEHGFFDLNINIARNEDLNDFVLDNKEPIKKIILHEKQWHGISQHSQQPVIANTLHFQGAAKQRMPQFYQLNNQFNLQCRHTLTRLLAKFKKIYERL